MRFNALTLTIAGVFLFGGAAEAQVTTNQGGNQAGFVASGQTATLDCAGGKAAVLGSNNVLTVSGSCTGLDMYGSGNKITVQFGPAAEISFVGSGNSIRWTSSDGKPPKVSYVGSGNELVPPITAR
jgi:Protein of unknown function (DUF3060)